MTWFLQASSFDDVKRLLRAGCDVNAIISFSGKTLLFELSLFEPKDGSDPALFYENALDFLLSHGVDLDFPDVFGRTALLCSDSDHFSEAVMKAGASLYDSFFLRSCNHQTHSALVSSAMKGHVRAMRYLIDVVGIDCDAFSGRGTALHHMLSQTPLEEWGSITGLHALIDHGASVDKRDFRGRTPLSLVYDNCEFASVLLDAGADVDANVPLTGHLWDFGYMVDDATIERKPHETCLHEVRRRSPEVLALLLERGACVDALNSDGNTPLMCLLSELVLTQHLLRVFNILIDFGASCTKRNKGGRTAKNFPLSKHPLLVERISEQVREDGWRRRLPFFLVLSKGVCDTCEAKGGKLGVVGRMVTAGYRASEGFCRSIVEYI